MAGARQRLPDRRARRAPVRADPPARAAALRGALRRVRRRRAGALPAGDPAHVADLRIFNPDGSEAELSGNGAREAILYLRRRGWTELDEFSIHTAAGTISPQITGPYSCRVDMGRATLSSSDFPSGPPDGTAELRLGTVRLPAPLQARRARGASSTSRSATRSARSPSPASTSSTRSTCRRSAPRSKATRVPQPHERLLVRRARPGDDAAARPPDPRADLRARRGGDALLGHRRDGRRRRLSRRRGRRRRPDRRRAVARDRRARRRRARGRGRAGPARPPVRLGAARVRRHAQRAVRRKLHQINQLFKRRDQGAG